MRKDPAVLRLEQALANGMTWAAAVRGTGLSISTLKRAVSGESRPRPNTLKTITKYLDKYMAFRVTSPLVDKAIELPPEPGADSPYDQKIVHMQKANARAKALQKKAQAKAAPSILRLDLDEALILFDLARARVARALEALS